MTKIKIGIRPKQKTRRGYKMSKIIGINLLRKCSRKQIKDYIGKPSSPNNGGMI